jgi:hypothetical protein
VRVVVVASADAVTVTVTAEETDFELLVLPP